MNLFKRYALHFITCLVLLGIVLFSTFNKQDKVINKEVGSDSLMATRLEVNSLKELIDKADLIIVGDVLTDGLTKNVTIGDDGNDKGGVTFDITENQVAINNVLYGSTDAKEITFQQLGKAGNNMFQTKVQKGNKVLLILIKDDSSENTYASVDFENGCFVISNNKVLSLSNVEAVAKYDNLNLNNLTQDIRKLTSP